ncbi:MAG: serine/threonine-protein kinase [Isosphaerales bacterium]
MSQPTDPSRDLLFGLLALQNGLIDQGALFAAFAAWTRDKTRSLADHLIDLGHLDAPRRAVVEAIAGLHVQALGGDPEKSLAVLAVGRSTRERLARAGGPEVEATLGHIRSAPGSTYDDDEDTDRTASSSVGSATSDGQRFRILRPHAKGGLGTVFVALDCELHREVALKQILEQHADDPESRQRFVAEAEITGRLEHPGVVPVYGLGTDSFGRPYYAMRFIKGDSLKEAIARFHGDDTLEADPGRRSLELRKLLRCFTDVCNAIDYAHSRGVIHRDLKPANIIVGKHGETLVVDWGLAKAVGRADPSVGEQTIAPSSSGSSETLPGSALGTPAYMSPEQARGELNRLGPRSDVYSLGATLYCLITGKPPFEGDDVGAILHAVQEGQFRRPSQHDHALDKALEAICLKALAKEPEDRYPTPRALADDLDRWMADEPVTAWREPLARRARRWARRNRTAVTSLAAAVLVALAGTAVVLAVQTQAKGRLVQANKELALANAREKQRFDLALEAIKLFHGEVGDDLVLKADQFKPLRDKLLRGAAEFYGKLEDLLKDQHDRASRGAIGNAYFELGGLTAKIGDKPAALNAHLKGLAVRRELASEPADAAEARADVAKSLTAAAALLAETGHSTEALARCEEARDLLEGLPLSGPGSEGRRALLGRIDMSIGVVLRDTGKTDAAMSAYQRSLETLTRLVDDNPAVAQFRNDLAGCHHNIGLLQFYTGKSAEALESLRRALAVQQKLADDNPAVTDSRRVLAHLLNNTGELQSKTGHAIEALESYGKALAIRQRLAVENPAVTQFGNDLATSLNSIGWLQTRTGKPDQGLASIQRALEIFQKLADDNPAVTQFRSSLAHTHHIIGMLQAETGKPGAAQESYRRTLAIQQSLADDYPAVIVFQSDLAYSHNNLGRLLSQTGKSVEALESYGRAVAILRRLANDNPAVTEFRSVLAGSHHNMGLVLRDTGKSSEAEAEYRKALAISQKVVDDNPAVTQFREYLANHHQSLGHLLEYDMVRLMEAEAEYRKAQALRQKLADDNPAVPEFRIKLAQSHNNLGLLLSSAGRSSEAKTEHRKALALFQKLADDHPAVNDFRRELGWGHSHLGGALLDAGEAPDAEAEYRTAIAIFQKLADDNPAVTDFRDSLASSLTNTADVLRRSGRLDAALAACERARVVREPLVEAHPEFPEYRARLGETYLRLGQVRCDMENLAGAAAAWKRACAHYDAIKSLSEEATFFLACCHAGLAGLAGRPGSGVSAAEGADQAEKAMAVLRQAVTMGYRNPNAYRTESALDPLRNRPDFRALMMDLAFPAQPFAP